MITCVLWNIESRELEGPSIYFEVLYIPQCTCDHCLSVLENGCNHEVILTFTIILEYCLPVYKGI